MAVGLKIWLFENTFLLILINSSQFREIGNRSSPMWWETECVLCGETESRGSWHCSMPHRACSSSVSLTLKVKHWEFTGPDSMSLHSAKFLHRPLHQDVKPASQVQICKMTFSFLLASNSSSFIFFSISFSGNSTILKLLTEHLGHNLDWPHDQLMTIGHHEKILLVLSQNMPRIVTFQHPGPSVRLPFWMITVLS